MRIVAVVPCHNEQKKIRDVLKRLAGYADEIVVVDDGSTDSTAPAVSKSGVEVTLLTNKINLGKGAAARTGCDYAVKVLKASILILVDGDGQHAPEDIPRFLELRKKRRLDIVFGLRRRTAEMPIILRLGNWGLSLLSRVLFGITVQDSQCGYRLLTREAYEKVRWQSLDYAMESEMIARAGYHKLKYDQLDIKTVYHETFKGTGIWDGIKIGLQLLKWRIISWQS